MSRPSSMLLVALTMGCGGRGTAPITPAATPSTESPATSAPTVRAAAAFAGHWVARGGGELEVAAHRDQAGPATVITPDGQLLVGEATVDVAIDTLYHVSVPGLPAPVHSGFGVELDALVLLPAVPAATVVRLSDGDRTALAAVIAAAFETPAMDVAPIVAVDVDGDGQADAALVHGCMAVEDAACMEDGDVLVIRADGTWTAP